MKSGPLIAAALMLATVVLVVIGSIWPVPSAVAYAGISLQRSPSDPEGAVNNLAESIRSQDWGRAYGSLANKTKFSESEFVQDLKGAYPNLRTYSSLGSFEAFPLHAAESEADVRLKLHWATAVGACVDTRDLHVVKVDSQWQVEWPIAREPVVPPQVVPVNYLRWDVIDRGPGDDWGVQDVEAPHVRILDMHPVQRADGVTVLGELLNEDVVPAYVSVTATLLAKNQSPITTVGSFDKISHLLLPKQVTPFLIEFPDVSLSDVGSIRMTPFSTLVSASADPVIAIDGEHLSPAPPEAALVGQLINESGRIVNVAHVLGTFYDKSGQVVWVADQYVDRALLPGIPAPFTIHIPEDLARRMSSERAVVSSFSFGGFS